MSGVETLRWARHPICRRPTPKWNYNDMMAISVGHYSVPLTMVWQFGLWIEAGLSITLFTRSTTVVGRARQYWFAFDAAFSSMNIQRSWRVLPSALVHVISGNRCPLFSSIRFLQSCDVVFNNGMSTRSSDWLNEYDVKVAPTSRSFEHWSTAENHLAETLTS